VTISLYTYQIC